MADLPAIAVKVLTSTFDVKSPMVGYAVNQRFLAVSNLAREKKAMSLPKYLVSKMPQGWQSEMKRMRFARQISNNSFLTEEPEYELLDTLVKKGDWVVDVGANVGHYTKRLSELVGAEGRVIAFEPVPETFALLSSNVQHFAHKNVTLINAAVSEKMDIAGISIPTFSSGLVNYYEAEVGGVQEGELSVLALTLDSLLASAPVALMKIDVEGHEAQALAGMKNIIESSRPTIILETRNQEIIDQINALGYNSERLTDSPNVLFRSK